jgi:hypothetical protein
MIDDRGVSSTLGTVFLVAVVVIVSATVAVQMGDVVQEARDTNEKPVPVTDNLLENPSFADGDEGWTVATEGTVMDGVGRRDTAGLKFAPPIGDGLYRGQNVTDALVAGETYRLCAYARTTNPDANSYVGVQFYNASGDIIAKATWRVRSSSFSERCRYTTTPNETSIQRAEVWGYLGPGPNGELVVDDYELVRTTYLADPDEDGGL